MSDEATETSGFSFLSDASATPIAIDNDTTGGMFGGLEVAECEVERSNELAVGGIESVETQMEPTKAEEEPVSAFSFIQSPSSDQLNSYDNSTNPILDDDGGTGVTEDTSGASSSGFGFLHQQENDITAPASQSSFSFIESEKGSATSQMGQSQATPPPAQEIKLEKAASSRQVKKKRRATKVGYARDEEPEEDAQPLGRSTNSRSTSENKGASVPPPAISSTVAPMQSVAESAETETLQCDRPAPIPSPTQSEAKLEEKESPVVSTVSGNIGAANVHSGAPSASVEVVKESTTEVPDPSPPAQEKKYSFFDIFRRGGHTAASEASHATPPRKQPETPTKTTPPVEDKAPAWKKKEKETSPASSVVTEREKASKPIPTATTSPAATIPVTNHDDMFSGMDTSISVDPTTNSASVHMTSSIVSPKNATVTEKIDSVTTVSNKPVSSRAETTAVSKKKAIDVEEENVVETLTRLGDEIVEQLVSMMGKMSDERQSLLSVITEGVQEMKVTESNIQRLRLEAKDIEAKQLRLGELEDFEGAAALSDPLQNCLTSISANEERVKVLNDEVQKAQKSISESHRFSVQDLEHTAKGLGNLKRQKEEEWLKQAKDFEQKYGNEDVSIKGEEERIQLEMTHVLREEESLNEEGAVIEAQISHQTETLSVAKTEIESRLHSTLGEIAELELALAAKKAEEVELREELSKTETGISEVRRKYERQLQRIYDRRTAAVNAQKECSQEMLAIKKERDRIEYSLVLFEKNKADNESWLELTNVEMLAISHFVEAVNTSLEMENEVGRESVCESAEIKESRANLMACEASLSDANAELIQIEARTSQLANESLEITEKLPQLGIEKKSHASAKRFKEAAATSKDIKQLSSRKEDIERELDQMNEDITLHRAQVCKYEAVVAAAKDEVKEAEKANDLIDFQNILQRAAYLYSSKSRLEGDEFKSDTKIVPIAIKLLDVELKSSLSEAAKLKEKHGIERSIDENALCALCNVSDTQNENASGVINEDPSVSELNQEDKQNDSDEELSSEKEEQPSENGLCAETPTEEFSGENEDQGENVSCAETSADGDKKECDAISNEGKSAVVTAVKAMHIELTDMENKLQDAVDTEDYDEAAVCSDRIDDLRAEIENV